MPIILDPIPVIPILKVHKRHPIDPNTVGNTVPIQHSKSNSPRTWYNTSTQTQGKNKELIHVIIIHHNVGRSLASLSKKSRHQLQWDAHTDGPPEKQEWHKTSPPPLREQASRRGCAGDPQGHGLCLHVSVSAYMCQSRPFIIWLWLIIKSIKIELYTGFWTVDFIADFSPLEVFISAWYSIREYLGFRL